MTTTSPMTHWNGLHGLPDFPAIKDGEFEAAFDATIASHRTEIETIANNAEAPTIANTLHTLELAGEELSHVSAVFWLRAGAHTNDTIRATERAVMPKLSRHGSWISMNPALFSRIDTLRRTRDTLDLDSETAVVLEKTWKGFVRSGAALDDAGKTRLAAINEQLASLGTAFGQNVLTDEAQWALFITDEIDLAGLPGSLRAAMKAAAEERDRPEAWAVTLARSIVEPFLTLSENRTLRESAFKAWAARGENGGDSDNTGIVAETVALRHEKAKLLGYDSFAALKLDNSMAKTPSAVMGLLEPVWSSARAKAAQEQAELQRIASADGANHDIAGWDWRFYADRLRREQFSVDDGQLKPYFQLENMIAASFDVAGRLFGLRFEEQTSVALWHPDARLWKVLDADGSERGLFAADYFARASKRSGAWMSALQGAHKLGDGQKPFIYNIMNFAKPPKGEPALLSLTDAKTLFHEFGHALHGMLSEAVWPSVSGTSVSRDWVELPSQLYEHWLTVPEILRKHAIHTETGEPIPQGLVDKVLTMRTFGSGFATVEFTASALVDMAFHDTGEPAADPIAFERQTLTRLQMPDAIVMRHRTPHFQHVFSGEGYAAGYYSYLWSEVLDADAFEAFEETGDAFNADLAHKLRTHVYASGGTADPEALYTAFRGRLPEPDAMMRGRGLV
jgi:peptidyl-dipeptidase Dcp